MKIDELARVGDVIECDVQNPTPHILYAKLATPEACAFGNELLQTGRWRKTRDEIASKLTFPEPSDRLRKLTSPIVEIDRWESAGEA